MGTIGASFGRIPNLLASQTALANLSRTNLSLFRTQEQLVTGRAINRYSDDAVKAAAVAVLDDRLERSAQTTRNLQHATSSLDTLDAALGDASDLILEAKSIASAQVNVGSTPQERQQQAIVINSLVQNLFNLVNRQSVAGSIFGGSTPGVRPVEEMLGGYRSVAQGRGLVTDLGLGNSSPITIGAEGSIGGVSTRVRGTVDLNPDLTAQTRLSDLFGARGVGVSPGVVEFAVDGGARVRVDLSAADTAGDVASALTAELRQYEQDSGRTILGPGEVSFSGGAFSIDLVAGAGGGPAVRFFDADGGVMAQDLGLTDAGGLTFTDASPAGMDTQPKLTWRTPISALAGLTDTLGLIRVNNLGQSRVVDLSGAATLGDLRTRLEGCGLGLRVVINDDATGIDVVNEVAGGRGQAMSIEEIAGSNGTATMLGIRSLSFATRIGDFNDGRGVQLVNGSVNPVTGLPDPALDVDFTVRLGDTGGTTFTVDLRPQDMATVQTLIDRINSQASSQGVAVPADFAATLGNGPNGITFIQNPSFSGAIGVQDQNNSPAARQLGLLDGVYDPSTGTFRADDRAKVRVDNLFTALIDLRDALTGNDTDGITLAGEKLEEFVDRVSQTRALVGGYAGRVQQATTRQEDQDVLDERVRSELRDVDYSGAAVRLSLLQTQLQAGLQTTALLQSRTLLDYL
jgi:flagellar hook-associated protein 3 FlgL